MYTRSFRQTSTNKNSPNQGKETPRYGGMQTGGNGAPRVGGTQSSGRGRGRINRCRGRGRDRGRYRGRGSRLYLIWDIKQTPLLDFRTPTEENKVNDASLLSKRKNGSQQQKVKKNGESCTKREEDITTLMSQDKATSTDTQDIKKRDTRKSPEFAWMN